MKNDEVLAVARECFEERGMNCAQATCYALMKAYGMDADLLAKTLTCFGGGVLRTRNVCGALSGALAALGAVHGSMGRRDDMEGYAACSRLGEEMTAWFEEANGSMLCSELIQVPRDDEEAFKAYQAKDGHKTICTPLVLAATQKMMTIMEGSL
ncbi:MAG: C-GCAxxG-C-C family protein [Christensenellales bacterium]|jgi:C_GCAxxG_C_C family probable redox protein